MKGHSFVGLAALLIGLFLVPPSVDAQQHYRFRRAAAKSYTTAFPLTENPISESGIWHNTDPTTTKVQTEVLSTVHVAHGTQSGGTYAPYDDSNAYLANFPLDHSIQGTIWKAAGIASSPNCEVELLLRWADDYMQRSTAYGPTSADGYEINLNQTGAYLNIGRFKGALLNNCTPTVNGSCNGHAAITPATGDVLKGQIATSGPNAVINVYWNGVLVLTYTDTAPHVSRGNPGIGFYRDAGAGNNQYGFSSITASTP